MRPKKPFVISNASDLAGAALQIVDLAIKLQYTAQLEFAAVLMATHVCDWHYRPKEPSDADKRNFAKEYPAWDTLRRVANGVKHPKGRDVSVEEAFLAIHEVISSDSENRIMSPYTFDVETTILSVDGESVSINQLVSEFCLDYISNQKNFKSSSR